MQATITEQLARLSKLGPNWDSYGADPPNPDCLRLAGSFFERLIEGHGVEVPFLAATRLGGVMGLWKLPLGELEVELRVEGDLVRLEYLFERETGRVEKGEIVLDLDEFVDARAVPIPIAVSGIRRTLLDAIPA